MNNCKNDFDCATIDQTSTFDPRQSIFIEASAGTGKTYTIQQIVARLIWHGENPDKEGVKLDQILIVTYTEKAAGELKKRIRDKLQEVCDSHFLVNKDTIPVHDIQPFKDALRNIDNAQVYTIHSFCQKVLREHAYDTGRPLDMKLVDDKGVRGLIERKFRDEWTRNDEFKELVRISKENTDSGTDNSDQSVCINKLQADIEDKLVNAVSVYYRSQDGKENNDVIALAEPLIIKDFNSLYRLPEFKSIFDALNNEKYFSYKFCVPNGKSTRSIKEVISLLREWRATEPFLKSYPIKISDDWMWPENEDTRIVSDNYLKLIDFKKKYKNYFDKDKYIDIYNRYKLDLFLYHVFPDLYLEWRDEKLANKQQSYNDMIHAVHMAVMDEHSNLVKEIREKYRYAIIDEFQDTNQLQWDIFSRIFLAGEESNPCGEAQNKHSIFVVGDPKQSIFSFQGADLEVYKKATVKRDPSKRRVLKTNYRSTDAMIESCNELFRNGFDIDFSDSDKPSNKLNPTFDGNSNTPAFWMPVERSSSSDDQAEHYIDSGTFAKMAAARIVDCCEHIDGPDETRLMVFDKDNPSKAPRRAVSFKDFVILARVRSEFVPIERELTRLGIPFVRYKDNNLFAGLECCEWIALFKALDVPDYSAANRKTLSEALLTDFFPEHPILYKTECCHVDNDLDKLAGDNERVPSKLDSVSHPYYDNPQCTERENLARWRKLACASQWAELQETIYRDSGIEARLSADLSKLQELVKLRQIGNYSVEYLYKNRCDLSTLIRHLEILRNKSGQAEDQDGNLVEKGTDLDAVRLMTIYSSKGLEFPVVISVAGFRDVKSSVNGPFVYHEGDKPCLGFGDDAKDRRMTEELQEWHRLFYVAYTRASSILMIPRYVDWLGGRKAKSYEFLKNSLDAFSNATGKSGELKHSGCMLLAVPDDYDKYKEKVQKILTYNKQTWCDTPQEESQIQVREIEKLQKKLGSLSLMQHSYSSLSVKVRPDSRQVSSHDEIVGQDASNPDKNDDVIDDAYIRQESSSDSYIDKDVVPAPGSYSPLGVVECETMRKSFIHYPRGTQLGNAVHEVFEFVDFGLYGSENLSTDDDQKLKELIHTCFDKYGVERNDETDRITADMIRHTLRAKLPVIHGTRTIPDYLSLNELKQGDHFAEVEFMLKRSMDKKIEVEAEHFCKGFMDLVFVHGNERYAVLDWKTNVLEPASYAIEADLKEVVDKEYDVQRVLYSYCLIEWLKSFYSDMTEEALFENHFGGVYYVFVRGCREGTSNGVYAQTWDSFDKLKSAYNVIRNKLMFK